MKSTQLKNHKLCPPISNQTTNLHSHKITAKPKSQRQPPPPPPRQRSANTQCPPLKKKDISISNTNCSTATATITTASTLKRSNPAKVPNKSKKIPLKHEKSWINPENTSKPSNKSQKLPKSMIITKPKIKNIKDAKKQPQKLPISKAKKVQAAKKMSKIQISAGNKTTVNKSPTTMKMKIKINDISKIKQVKTPSQSHEYNNLTPPNNIYSSIPGRHSFSSVISNVESPTNNGNHKHDYYNSYSSIAAESILGGDDNDENNQIILTNELRVHARNITDSLPCPQWL